MAGTREDGDLVLVADVHIGAGDPELPAFRAFLADRARDTAVLVLLGDIFSLWLGEPQYTAPHHLAVLDECRALRRAGVRVVFIEGNREFSVRRWRGDAFDDVLEELAAEPWAGRRWYLAHGDLLNREDRAGRLFRHAVRSFPARLLLRSLPGRIGLAIGEHLEESLRHRNLRHKTSIPAHRFERYAAWFAGRGFDAGVIGHIHVERQLDLAAPDGTPRTLYVLPDWRSTHRFLRIPRSGVPRFDGWGEARAVPPAVIEVVERGPRVEIAFDVAPGLAPGASIVIGSGHGSGVRRGTVLSVRADDPCRLTVELASGAPIQVGDRVVLGPAQS